MQTEAMKGISS